MRAVKIAVKDANVFIDLEAISLFDLWFQLGYITMTTTFIIDELERGGHELCLQYVHANMIHVRNYGDNDLGMIDDLYQDIAQQGASVADASVLYLAEQEGAILLTGDKALRTAAKNRKVSYHGTYWIMNELVKHSLLTPTLAIEKLEYLLNLTGEKRRFLPRKEAAELLEQWRQMD
jgi:rRNA-processing protein FCF1